MDLSIEEAPDFDLEDRIIKAQHVILHYVQISVKDEIVNLDPSGTTVTLRHRYLADTNFNKEIDALDLQIYGWTSSDNIESRSILTISTIFPEHGIVKLSEDASSYQKITADYSYYTCAIDWNLLAMATTYYAAMLWVSKEEFLVPDEFTIGNVKVRQKQPWEKLRSEFLRLIFHLTTLPMDLVNYKKISVKPRSKARYQGPGTTIELEDSIAGARDA